MFLYKVTVLGMIIGLSTLFAFLGCEKSNPTNVGSPGLIGTWNLSSMTQAGQPVTFADMGIDSLGLVMKADSSYIVHLYQIGGILTSTIGTFTTSGDNITFTQTGSTSSTGTYSLSGNNVTFSLSNTQLGNYTQTFIRQ
jgi:hypothetical protein